MGKYYNTNKHLCVLCVSSEQSERAVKLLLISIYHINKGGQHD